MAIFKKNVSRRDVRDNLVEWIRKGIEFSTPVRDTGMMTTRGYYGGLRTATISGRIEHDAMQNPMYVVYSYQTPIMWVTFADLEDDGDYTPISAEFDNRKYSATTNIMQGYCESALMDLFDIPHIPDIIGKRGGRYRRRNFMGIAWIEFPNTDFARFEWFVRDSVNGDYIGLCVDGDSYKDDDTEGSFCGYYY